MNMAMFIFESCCVQGDKFCDTITTTWIGKDVPINVSISSNLIEQRIFWRYFNSRALVESYVGALDGLATQSKAQLKWKFLEIEISMASKINSIFSTLNQRHCRRKPVMDFEDECIEEEQDVSTHFLQNQKN